jgi:hypothetical protein
MENFSTQRAPLLPQAANLATLAVVVAATWWSGSQRPADTAALNAQAPARQVSTTTAALRQSQAPGLGATGSPMSRPVVAQTLPLDGLQAVRYQPTANR